MLAAVQVSFTFHLLGRVRLAAGGYPDNRVAFPHSAGTAPIITVFIPGTPLQTTPLQKRA